MSILVFLSSEYLSLISNNSCLIIAKTFSSLAKIALYSSIFFNNSASSASILSLSNPVNLLNFISKIASLWILVKAKLLINFSFASASVLEPLIIFITSSIWSKAIFKPSKICTLSSAFFKSNLVLLIIISFW